jgi:hypothetical protein
MCRFTVRTLSPSVTAACSMFIQICWSVMNYVSDERRAELESDKPIVRRASDGCRTDIVSGYFATANR